MILQAEEILTTVHIRSPSAKHTCCASARRRDQTDRTSLQHHRGYTGRTWRSPLGGPDTMLHPHKKLEIEIMEELSMKV